MRFMMRASVKDQSGYEAALMGLGLNKKQGKDMSKVAQRLASKDFGHNKFLESIYIWVLVLAPRYWWQEADTFRLSTKQSESTMHTLVTELEKGIDWNKVLEDPSSITPTQIELINRALVLEDPIEKLVRVKQCLPEGFLQQRMWCMSYKTLRNIAIQRRHHRLPHWREFLLQTYAQLEYTELLPEV